MWYRLSLILMLGLVSCKTTQITSSWKAPHAASLSEGKILVLGLLPERERPLREAMEHQLANDLRASGLQASSALEVYGPQEFQQHSEAEVLEQLHESGFRAVLTIVLLDKQRERYYIPGHVSYTPFVVYRNHFYGYYQTMYTRIYSPGYYQVNTRWFWESNLYDLSGPGLLYSVQTQSFNPSGSSNLAREYSQLIVEDMIRHQILNGSLQWTSSSQQP
jgi:hypothetical protein